MFRAHLVDPEVRQKERGFLISYHIDRTDCVNKPEKERATNYLYLKVVSVSIKVKETLNLVESVVFEVALHDPETVNGLIDCKQLESGRSLKNVLSTSLFHRLKTYMRRFKQRSFRRSLELGQSRKQVWEKFNSLTGSWDSKRPIWLLFLLYQLNEEENYEKFDAKAPMLDAFLAHSAQERGKTLHSIETAREQCNPLIRVDQEQVIFAINYTLSYLEWNERRKRKRKESTVQRLVRLYRCGNPEVANFESDQFETDFSLTEEFDRQAKQVDLNLKLDIIENRNVRMAARAHQLIRENPKTSFLFAIGAGHFYGPFSLLNVLRNYGYVIEQVKEDADISHLLRRPNNFKTFNELWVRQVKEMEVMSIQDERVSSQSTYLYLLLCLIPVVLIVLRHVGRRIFLQRPPIDVL